MPKMNVKWHEQHVMPKRASLEQRIEWHREHRAECACRPIPGKLLEQMAQLEQEGRTAAPSTGVAESKFSNIVLAFAQQPSVSYGGKGFGSSALKLGGKIFAMLTSRGQFVVKLSRERVEELVGLREGECFDPGHGRLMKEWLVVPGSSTRWLELAKEAHANAAGRPGRLSRPASARSAPRRVAPARPANARTKKRTSSARSTTLKKKTRSG